MLGEDRTLSQQRTYNRCRFINISQIFRGKAWSVCDRIKTRSANVVFQTSQSLASQITSQIVGSEINVTFRYNPKKLGGHGVFPR
jgi:hypothetical protein